MLCIIGLDYAFLALTYFLAQKYNCTNQTADQSARGKTRERETFHETGSDQGRVDRGVDVGRQRNRAGPGEDRDLQWDGYMPKDLPEKFTKETGIEAEVAVHADQ